ncbi:hypothetical protein Bca4012_101228 [Brassica carinata]
MVERIKDTLYLSIPLKKQSRFREPPRERDNHRLRVHRLPSPTRATEWERNRRFVEESTERERERKIAVSSRRAPTKRELAVVHRRREKPVETSTRSTERSR